MPEETPEEREQHIVKAANGLGRSAEKVETQSRLSLTLVKVLALVMFIQFVFTVGLAVLVQRNNANSEDTQVVLNEVQVSVRHLENFVEAIEAAPEDEAARDAAISEAVRIVPEIRAILCEEFPEATACQ